MFISVLNVGDLILSLSPNHKLPDNHRVSCLNSFNQSVNDVVAHFGLGNQCDGDVHIAAFL